MEEKDVSTIHLVKILHIKIGQRLNEIMAQYGLTSNQSMFLHYLDHHQEEEVSPVDLAHHFEISHPCTVGILKRMEESKLVTLTQSTRDNRYKVIHMTAKGKKLEQAINLQVQEQMPSTLIKDISAKDLATYRQVTQQMIENMKKGITHD